LIGWSVVMDDQDRRKVAEVKLARACGTTVALWQKLKRFHEIASGGLPSGVERQVHLESTLLRNMVESGELDRYLYDPSDGPEFVRLFESAKMRAVTAETNQSIINAACVVFAHGILEGCVHEYLAVTAAASPERWECYIKGKKIEVATLKDESFEQVCESMIERLLGREVKRESLISKLDRLHRIAPPGQYSQGMKVSYERERLVAFDEARHKIVHGNDWRSYAFDFAEEWSYWYRLNFYFACLVCENTGVKLSTKIMGQYLWKPTEGE